MENEIYKIVEIGENDSLYALGEGVSKYIGLLVKPIQPDQFGIFYEGFYSGECELVSTGDEEIEESLKQISLFYTKMGETFPERTISFHQVKLEPIE